MSAEAGKPKEGDKPAAHKKKGLPPIALIALGAIAGGAGTVSFLPKPKPTAVDGAKEPEYEEVNFSGKKMSFGFNPKAERGNPSARISFTFTVKMKKEKGEEDRIKRLIEDRWEKASSRVLEILTAQAVPSLKSVEGKQQVKRMIQDELSVSFFPRAEATILDVYWGEFIIQG